MAIKISVESNDTDNEFISAFSYNTGKVIEEIIRQEVGNIKENNKILESKVLEFCHEIKNPLFKKQYKEFFNIKSF